MGGDLRELGAERVFTRIGRSLGAARRIPEEKLREEAEVVARQARRARELGAEAIDVVATSAVREALNGAELVATIEAGTGLAVRVLSARDEARLAFVGATRTLGGAPGGHLAVVDVGGGSTEVAFGTAARGVEWSVSLPVGSGALADAHLSSDPPTPAELAAARRRVAQALEDMRAAPAPTAAVAVGGSATSLRRVAGATLDAAALDRALAAVASAPSAAVAREHALEPERARLLPAGIIVLRQVAERLSVPLRVGNGGLREGLLLERAAASRG